MQDLSIFYRTFLIDYHKIKSNYLIKIIGDSNKYEKEFCNDTLDDEEKNIFKKTLQIDLRQNYFHAIETFFELFFALNPVGTTEQLDDRLILERLLHSHFHKNKEIIKDIAENPNALDYFFSDYVFQGHKITIGEYLFYMGIVPNNKFPKELFTDIHESIEAIKFGITIIAKDFSDRKEYNSYKHGLRAIPTMKSIAFHSLSNEKQIKFDLSDSVTFLIKDNERLKSVTKVLDSKRDYMMTQFCSNLIKHLIYYRYVSMFKNQIKEDQIKITFFSRKLVEDCAKHNVKITHFEY